MEMKLLWQFKTTISEGGKQIYLGYFLAAEIRCLKGTENDSSSEQLA